MKRTEYIIRRKIARAILIILAVVAIWSLLCGAVREKRQIVGYEYIAGTSLWDLARGCPCDMDKREYIAEVVELNAVHDNVVYADRLYQVPVYEE